MHLPKEVLKDGTVRQRNLTDHPEWRDKWPDLKEQIDDEIFEDYTQGPKLEKAKNKQILNFKFSYLISYFEYFLPSSYSI